MTRREEAPEDGGRRRDSDLVDAIVDGDLAALDALYRRHASLAYSLALRLTGDDTLAQNAVQSAFMSLWSDRPAPDRETEPVRRRLVQLVAQASMHGVRNRSLPGRGGIQRRGSLALNQPPPMLPQST